MKKNDLNRRNEKITGAFFISAAITAIIGSILYNPVLKNDDFFGAVESASTIVSLGAVFELLLAFSCIGTGIMFYPYLKRYSESWGLGYVLFRLLEVVFILIGVVSMLLIVSMSHFAVNGSEPELLSLHMSAKIMKTIYGWTFILGPHFMLGINTFIYSSIFYKSRILPQNLALTGMLSAGLILLAAILELLGYVPHFSPHLVIMALPIAVYEMVLAFRLIRTGFNKEAYMSN